MKRTWRFALALPLLAVAASPGDAAAQQRVGTLTGVVTNQDTGQPLSDAYVAIANTRFSTLTNAQGRFLIPGIPAGTYTVIVQNLGFAEVRRNNVRIEADGTTNLEIAMEPSVLPLQELVVTGVSDPVAGVKLPFTVSRVNTEQLQVPTTSSALASMQGKVAGAHIIQASGKPGSGVNIILRSPTGFESSNSPLIVVDGVVIARELDVTTGDIDGLDIESIEVIKGAAAASLYGSRAAAGVVSITTSRGKSLPRNQTQIRSRTEIGKNFLGREMPISRHHHYLMNADGTSLVNSAGRDTTWAGRTADPNRRIADKPYPGGKTYDNLHALYNPGQYLSQQVTFAYNSEATTFNISLTRLDHGGAMVGNEGYWRNVGRISVDHRIGDKLSFSFVGSHTRSWEDDVSGNPYEEILIYPAYVDLTQKDENGNYLMAPDPTVEVENPLWRQFTRDNYTTRARTWGSLQARFSPFPWLTADAQVSYDRADTKSQTYVPKGVPLSITEDQPATGRLALDHQENNAVNGAAGVTLTRQFGDLNTRLALRSTFEREYTEYFFADGRDFLVRDVRDLSAAGTLYDMQSSTADIRALGHLADLALDYKDRYLGSFLIRRDGSSLFGPEERWHTYRRASAAWRISQEPWFNIPFVNELKLRYAMGEAGGRPGFSWQYERWTVSRTSGLGRETAGNSALKPQFTREQEVGLDIIAFNNRVSLELVYAHQVSKDQIIVVPATAATGYSSRYANAGEMTGKTYEVTLQAFPIRRRNLSWSINLVADHTDSRLTKWERACFFGSNAGRDHEFTCAGQRAGDFWVRRTLRRHDELPPWLQDRADEFAVNDEGYLVWVGKDSLTGEPYSYKDGIAKNLWGRTLTVNGITYRWGEPFQQVDENGLPVRYNAGKSLPDINFGFGTNLSYRGFSAYAQFRGQIGGHVYNAARQWMYYQLRHGDLDQSGKPDELKKTVDYYQRGLAANNNDYIDVFVEDGTHLKLSELSLRYRFNRDQLAKVFGSLAPADLTLGINGRNLFILTNYSGFDPERGTPLSRVESIGYPHLRTWTATIDITF